MLCELAFPVVQKPPHPTRTFGNKTAQERISSLSEQKHGFSLQEAQARLESWSTSSESVFLRLPDPAVLVNSGSAEGPILWSARDHEPSTPRTQ